MDTIVVRTTYRGRADEYDESVAISGPGILARFVDPSPDEHDGILRQLQFRIARLEADEVARWKKERIAVDGKDDFALKEVGMATTASGTRYVDVPPRDPIHEYGLTRGEKPVRGPTYYQLHGERLFRMRQSEECFMRLRTEGVVVGVAGKVDSEKLGSFADSELCGDAAESSHELATVTIGSRTWWIVKTGGGEGGVDYGLFDPRTAQPVDIKGLWGLRSNRER